MKIEKLYKNYINLADHRLCLFAVMSTRRIISDSGHKSRFLVL